MSHLPYEDTPRSEFNPDRINELRARNRLAQEVYDGDIPKGPVESFEGHTPMKRPRNRAS